MNHIAALGAVSTILGRASITLPDRQDYEARELLSACDGVRYRVHYVNEHPDVPRDVVRKIVDDTTALNERIAEYAAKHRIRYVLVDTAPTLRMRRSDFPPEIRDAIESMKPGDTLPPPPVAALLEETVAAIGGPDRRASTMIPPPPPTGSLLPPWCLDDDSE